MNQSVTSYQCIVNINIDILWFFVLKKNRHYDEGISLVPFIPTKEHFSNVTLKSIHTLESNHQPFIIY